MSHNINSKNRDPLAELFRQKLENHRVAVDDNGWGELKKSLGGNKKMTLWLVTSAISAAVIALLFILSPSDKDPIDTPLQGESTTIIDSHNDKAIADDMLVEPQQKEKEEVIAQSGNKMVATNKIVSAHTTPVSVVGKQTSADREKEAGQDFSHAIPTAEHEDENKANVKSDYVAVADVPVVIIPSTEEDEHKQVENRQTYITDLLPELEEETVKKKEKRNWTIAAVYGGSTSGNEDVNSAQVPLRTSSSFDETANSNLLAHTAVKEWGEGNHFPEMSFSLTIGKRVSKRIAIESGLTYTYLYSKFDGAENVSNYELKQHLHYIGIPVNVTAYLLGENSKWSLYASGGVMFEKGLRATYKEAVNEIMEQNSGSWSESISGVQWSVNASVGASYDLSKSFSLFIAPRVSYYFDNDQPKSIRTNKDVSFGLNIGLKYNL